MVLISSVKYACETCIKGHRSSACKHTDRPLFEIKKKGRPVTQCEHCRELRKTKQVHIKCVCTTKQVQPDDLHGNKKGISRTLECAAFPNGLPEAMEASVAMQLASETSSDSDHGTGCCCKSGTECHCWTPRKTTRKSRRKLDNTTISQIHTEPPPPLDSSQTPAHIRARIAEFRPVLPKPSVDGHDPSVGHVHRYHNHETPFYSPYGRAYDYSHSANTIPQQNLASQQEPAAMDPAVMSWLYGSGAEALPYGSVCGCGDHCRCPGCTLHNGADFTSSAAFASCMNPATCGACLNCSLQTPPFDTTLDYQGFDDWIRQLPSNTPFSTGMDLAQMPIPKISEPVEKGAAFVGSGDCGPVCGCPPGFCQCESDGKRCLPDFAVSDDRQSHGVSSMTYQMPPANLLVVNDPLRSRSSSTSSDSSGFSSGRISAHSQGSSLSLPMSTSTVSFPNTIGSGLHFWST